MDHSLHIHRFQARHRLPDAAARQLALDAQARLLDGELEAALARVTAPDEVVLLKRLYARVRLSRRGSDRDHARAWSDALALSLQHALQQAGNRELLRFANRQQALQAFVADALLGESTRDWAWQQLALLPATRERVGSAAQRRQALLRLLADDAQDSVPLLRKLLACELWPLLVAQLHDGELRGLAHAVLARLAGASAAAFADPPEPIEAAVALPAVAGEDAAPVWCWPTLRAAANTTRARWALRLATMLAAPGLARRGAAAIDRQVTAWTSAALRSAAPGAAAQAEPAPEPSDPSPQRDDRAARDAAPSPGQAATAPSAAAAPEATPSIASANLNASLGAPLPHAAGPRTDTPAAASAAKVPAKEEETSGHTRHGGLLLLPPLLPLCGALPVLEDPALWPKLPQALHALALRLWPMAEDDPAALAFCGLAPSQPPPEREPAPTELVQARQAALERAHELLLDHLATRLPDWRGPALLSRLLCRQARINADPGWIDVIFTLRDVSTELRRAALDLDPGFLPWLGVVLRYRYE